MAGPPAPMKTEPKRCSLCQSRGKQVLTDRSSASQFQLRPPLKCHLRRTALKVFLSILEGSRLQAWASQLSQATLLCTRCPSPDL